LYDPKLTAESGNLKTWLFSSGRLTDRKGRGRTVLFPGLILAKGLLLIKPMIRFRDNPPIATRLMLAGV